MKKVFSYFKNYKYQSILSPLFKLLEASFELIVPLVIAAIIDVGIKNGDKHYILMRVGLLGLFALVGFVCAICAQYFAAKAASGISSDIRSDLFRKIQHLSITDFETIGYSNLVTGLTSDVNQIQSGINLTLRLLLRSPFIVFGAMIMAFTISFKAALIFVVAVALLGLIVGFNMKQAIPSYKKTRKSLDTLVRATDNGLSGVKVIRGFNRTADDYRAFEEKSTELNRLQKEAAKISSYLNPTTFLVINLAICILIYRGSIMVGNGSLSQGQVVALYNYMSQILVELIKLANLIVTVSRAIACASRVEELMLTEDGMCGKTAKIDNPSDAHRIEFKNVSFTYEGNSEETLTDVSFVCEKGSKIGVIGATGSGKSTIAQLTAGMYSPTSGSILVDGVDLSTVECDSLHRTISLCIQRAAVFTGTIRDNIKVRREFVTEENIADAVRISCCDDIIASKSEGLETEVQFSGSGLSGGQRQRIGIARCLAGLPGVLIFDDSTSALDSATEKRFLKGLTSMDRETTQIIVSQKISTVKNLDKILFLDDGEVEAFASHDELMKISEKYRKMVALQREEALYEAERYR